MTSLDNFNRNLYKFINENYRDSTDSLSELSDAIWELLGETPEQFCIEQEITFS